jgi:hypothetical protein
MLYIGLFLVLTKHQPEQHTATPILGEAAFHNVSLKESGETWRNCTFCTQKALPKPPRNQAPVDISRTSKEICAKLP